MTGSSSAWFIIIMPCLLTILLWDRTASLWISSHSFFSSAVDMPSPMERKMSSRSSSEQASMS